MVTRKWVRIMLLIEGNSNWGSSNKEDTGRSPAPAGWLYYFLVCYLLLRHRKANAASPRLIPAPGGGDGNLDVIINGNDFGTDIGTGRYDALNGLILKGDGKGNFKPLTIQQAGIYIPGDGKALVALRSANNTYMLAASQNKSTLKLFSANTIGNVLPLLPNDMYVIITNRNGSKRKQEVYFGNSFLSQSANLIITNNNMQSIEVTNNKNERRRLKWKNS